MFIIVHPLKAYKQIRNHRLIGCRTAILYFAFGKSRVASLFRHPLTGFVWYDLNVSLPTRLTYMHESENFDRPRMEGDLLSIFNGLWWVASLVFIIWMKADGEMMSWDNIWGLLFENTRFLAINYAPYAESRNFFALCGVRTPPDRER